MSVKVTPSNEPSPPPPPAPFQAPPKNLSHLQLDEWFFGN